MPHGSAFHVLVSAVQGPKDLGLARTRVANDKDRMSDMYQLFQLYHLQYKVVLRLKTKLLGREGGKEGEKLRGRKDLQLQLN